MQHIESLCIVAPLPFMTIGQIQTDIPYKQRFLSCMTSAFTKSFEGLACRVVGLKLKAMQVRNLCPQDKTDNRVTLVMWYKSHDVNVFFFLLDDLIKDQYQNPMGKILQKIEPYEGTAGEL